MTLCSERDGDDNMSFRRMLALWRAWASRVGVLYLFKEAQAHWLPVLGVPPRVVPYTWLILKCRAI